MKLQHLVVTRLTVKLFYEGFSRDWLEERLRLFRTYCVPGMAAQTIDDYQWLILCDEDTDRDFVESIEETRSLMPQLHVASTSKEHGVQILDAVSPFIEADTELLITTRLDGDDSLHSETIESVQSYADAFARSANQSWLLDFPRGYRYDETSGRLYESFWMSSPFSSLFEKLRPGRAPKNAYRNHHKLHLFSPTHFDLSIPAWMQVIHGRAEERSGQAVSSGNRDSAISRLDVEVDSAEVADTFGAKLADASHPKA